MPRAVEEREAERGDDVAVRVDRALRAAGRAARVEDDRGVVLRDRLVGQRRVEVVVPQRIEVVFDHDRRDARVRALEAGQALPVRDQHLGIRVLDPVADLGVRPTSR